jgi:hypothetical protein
MRGPLNVKEANAHNNDCSALHNIVHRIIKGAIYILLKYLRSDYKILLTDCSN